MERRDLLLLGGGVLVGGTALGSLLTMQTLQRRQDAVESLECFSSLQEERPDAVYYPTHVDGMQMIDTLHGDEYAVTFAYTFPHPFWTLSGTRVERVDQSGHVHLMCVVQDEDTGRVLPVDSGPSLRVTQQDTTVTEGGTWPMVSQQMGVHFGDNVTLDRLGDTEVEVTVPPLDVDLAGGYEGRFREQEVFTASFDYDPEQVEDLACVGLEERGERGAVGPETLHERTMDDGEMEELEDRDGGHGHAVSRTPAVDELPGDVVGAGESGDADVVAVSYDGDLLVSVRTPYNRYPLPMASVSARVDRDGGTVFDDSLSARLHPDMGFHYYAAVDIEDDDVVAVSFDAPPQVSRHMGYETAFVEMSDVEFTV